MSCLLPVPFVENQVAKQFGVLIGMNSAVSLYRVCFALRRAMLPRCYFIILFLYCVILLFLMHVLTAVYSMQSAQLHA
jgi:hypothetical protein